MKRNCFILTITLILTGLLSLPSISHAQKVPKGGRWDQKADMPTARSDVAASVVNNLIYVAGGWTDKFATRLATFEVYNPATDTWKKLKDIPTVREQLTTSAVNGKIYLLGGFTTVERRGKKILKALKTVDVYDPAADAWEQTADMPVARTAISSSVSNGKIYVIGGQDNVGGGKDSLDIYDSATDTWAQGAKTIERRWLGPSSSAVNGKIYVFGGFRKENHWIEFVEEYDPAADTWIRKADQPTPRSHAGIHAPTVGGKIYSIAGLTAGGQEVKIVEQYDPAKDQWGAVNRIPNPRMAFDTAVVRGKIYVIGGSTGGGARGGRDLFGFGGQEVATVDEYTAEGWPFAVSPQGKLATTWGTIKTVD